MDNCKIIDLADGEGMIVVTCTLVNISLLCRNLWWQSC